MAGRSNLKLQRQPQNQNTPEEPTNVLYTNLPKGYVPRTKGPKTLDRLLRPDINPHDAKNLDKDLQWHFLLEKHQSRGKKQRQIRQKKTFLTRKERRKLNILKLPKQGWRDHELDQMRSMWLEYMRQNLDLCKGAPDCTDPNWPTFSTIVSKSELIGAVVTVVRSKVVSQVGLRGTVVLETKMTFQIVTGESELKIIAKNTSVFELWVDQMRFVVFGKHLITKPSERSVKKIRSQMRPDLV